MKYILIGYDEQTAASGQPIDLYDYLVNELDSAHIEVQIAETTPECTCDEYSWRGPAHASACPYAGQPTEPNL